MIPLEASESAGHAPGDTVGDTVKNSILRSTRPTPSVLAVLAMLVVLAWAPPAAAQAQEPYNFTGSLFLGLAGSTDADPGDGLDNMVVQAGFNFVQASRAQLAFRLGRFDLDSERQFGSLFDAELTYLTVAGEYRLPESFYDSGVFAGLGVYRLEGTPALAGGNEETAAGVHLGVLGDFEISRRFSILVELSGHYVDFEDSNVFVMGLAGVGMHFR